MFGAIIGDLAGSIYEYDQLKEINPVVMNQIIENKSFYSDDTILTVAILDAILNNRDYSYYLKKYILEYENYKPDFKPYFKTPFSLGTMKWAKSDTIGESFGNGAMMRISPVGYLFNTEKDVIENAYLATVPSHNSLQAIKCSRIIALMIYYFRLKMTKDEVYEKLNLNVEYKDFDSFNYTCDETLKNCLYAIYNSTSFEDAIKITLNMGGDTDTNCCIVGSVCEAIYGIDEELKIMALKKIPKNFQDKLLVAEKLMNNS